MATINKPSQPLTPAADIEEVEGLIDDAIAADTSHAPLVENLVPAENLPSYVDDVLEFASLDEFPEEGEEGKIYVAFDTNSTYRWSGSTYIQVGGSDNGDPADENHTLKIIGVDKIDYQILTDEDTIAKLEALPVYQDSQKPILKEFWIDYYIPHIDLSGRIKAKVGKYVEHCFEIITSVGDIDIYQDELQADSPYYINWGNFNPVNVYAENYGDRGILTVPHVQDLDTSLSYVDCIENKGNRYPIHDGRIPQPNIGGDEPGPVDEPILMSAGLRSAGNEESDEGKVLTVNESGELVWEFGSTSIYPVHLILTAKEDGTLEDVYEHPSGLNEQIPEDTQVIALTFEVLSPGGSELGQDFIRSVPIMLYRNDRNVGWQSDDRAFVIFWQEDEEDELASGYYILLLGEALIVDLGNDKYLHTVDFVPIKAYINDDTISLPGYYGPDDGLITYNPTTHELEPFNSDSPDPDPDPSEFPIVDGLISGSKFKALDGPEGEEDWNVWHDAWNESPNGIQLSLAGRFSGGGGELDFGAGTYVLRPAPLDPTASEMWDYVSDVNEDGCQLYLRSQITEEGSEMKYEWVVPSVWCELPEAAIGANGEFISMKLKEIKAISVAPEPQE